MRNNTEIYIVVEVRHHGMEYTHKNVKAFYIKEQAEKYKVKYERYMSRNNDLIRWAHRGLDEMTEENQHWDRFKAPMGWLDKYGTSKIEYNIEIETLPINPRPIKYTIINTPSI